MIRKVCRGSIFLEAVLVTGTLFIPALVLTVELGRATQVQATLHHLAFSYVRNLALAESDAAAKRFALSDATRGLPEREQRRWGRVVDFSSGRDLTKGGWARVRIRYSGLLAWIHSRFQMTKTCSFSI